MESVYRFINIARFVRIDDVKYGLVPSIAVCCGFVMYSFIFSDVSYFCIVSSVVITKVSGRSLLLRFRVLLVNF